MVAEDFEQNGSYLGKQEFCFVKIKYINLFCSQIFEWLFAAKWNFFCPKIYTL